MTPISPGTLLAGRFRLVDLLEETGGARFWRATDVTLMRDVAVHVVDESDPRAQPLLAAARASATVSGPHLLRVLDAAAEDGVVYVVNEWGNGVSLDKMLLDGPLHPRQAAWLVREVADGVADAHRVGVAHGRLIPENVMVSETGAVKIIGFVIDGVLHGHHDNAPDEQDDDVRNLASLLYAGLVGRWPGTPGTVLPEAPSDHDRVLSPRQVRAGVPRALDRVCDSVLNGSDPSFPVETAHDIRALLSDFLGETEEGLALSQADAGGEPTQAIALADLDPDATQAGLPAFADTSESSSRAESDSTEGDDPVPALPSTRTPYVGMGGGSLPPAWGPDAEQTQVAEEPEWDGGPAGTPWLRLAGLVAAGLTLLVVVVFAFNLGRGDSGEPDDDPGRPSAAPTPVQPADVRDFDPFGDPTEENPETVANVVDGDPETTWQTNRYNDGPALVIKPGVGLLVDLGAQRTVSDVELTLVGRPTAVRLLAAPDGEPPTDIEGLQEVAAEQSAGPSVTLGAEEPVKARYLVVWMTSLPPVQGGFRGEVAELVVRS